MGRPSKYPAEFRREGIELVKTSGRARAEVAGGWRWGEPAGDDRTPYARCAGDSVAYANGAPPIDGWGGALVVLGRRWFELRRLCVAACVDTAPGVDGTNGVCEVAWDQVCSGTMGSYHDVNLGCASVDQRIAEEHAAQVAFFK
jgi:hypothetical protein